MGHLAAMEMGTVQIGGHALAVIAAGLVAGCETASQVPMQDVRAAGLELSCDGTGSRWSSSTNFNNKDKRGNTTGSSLYRENIAGTVRYIESANGPVMRLFSGLMPGLNPNGGGKWRNIRDYVKTDARISGRVMTGGLGGEAQFTISRNTGDIQIQADGATFEGTCHAVQGSTGPRF